MLNLVTLQIPNAAVLLFPAWFQAGKEGPQGIEATGQRIVFVLGQVIVFVLTLIPAALPLAGVFLLELAFPAIQIPATVVIPFGLIAAAVIIGAEAAVGLLLLGKIFDRFDVSAEASK